MARRSAKKAVRKGTGLLDAASKRKRDRETWGPKPSPSQLRLPWCLSISSVGRAGDRPSLVTVTFRNLNARLLFSPATFFRDLQIGTRARTDQLAPALLSCQKPS